MPQDLRSLFQAVTATAARTQATLDERLPQRPAWVYTLRKVDVDARFGATQTEGKVFIWFGNSSRKTQEHILHFSLRAAPEQPAAASRAAAAVEVRAPAFLVPADERTAIIDELKRELRGPEFRREIEKIDEATRKASDDPGVTMFRIDANCVLIVRLGGDNDGVFLRNTLANPRYTIFSYHGAEVGPLPWQPFRDLFDSLRSWQRERCALVPIGGLTPPSRFGSVETARFTAEVSDAAAAAESASRPSGPAVYPVRYALSAVSADLAYSVARGTGSDDAAREPLIRSVARVAVPGDGPPRVDLLAPEYILTGAQRDAFFELFDAFLQLDERDRRGLWRHLNKEYVTFYRRALEDRRRRRDAIVLLSYRGKTPLNQFLVVWTGNIPEMGVPGEERDFAFRVKLDGKNLVYDGVALPLEDPLRPGSPIPSGQRPFRAARVEYDSDHPILHDFFHASWIWDLAGDWRRPER